MASGTLTGGATYGCYARIAWSSSAGTGGSQVSATLYWVPNGGYYFTYRNGYSLSIHTSGVSGSGAVQSGSGAKALLSHSVWIGYYGDCQIGINGSVDLRTVTNSSTGNKLPIFTVGGMVALDRVGSPPPQVGFTAPATQTISEKGGNITVSWNRCNDYSGAAVYDVAVRRDGGAWSNVWTNIPNGTTSKVYTIPEGQGNSYQFRIITRNNVGSSAYSYSNIVKTNKLSPPTFKIPSSYNPFTQGANLTLTVTTQGSSTDGSLVKNMFSIYQGDTYVVKCNAVSLGNTSATVTYSANDYLKLLGSKNYDMAFRVISWSENSNGTRSSYKEDTLYVNINTDNGANPDIGDITLSGGVLDRPSTCFLAGITPVIVNVPDATLKRAPTGTTVSYTVTMEGVGQQVGQSCKFENLTSGIKTITVVATDSRGLSVKKIVKCVVQNWSAPTIAITSCSRIDDGNTARLSYSITYSPIYEYPTYDSLGEQINTIIKQQYRVNSGAWTDMTNNVVIPDLNTELSYNISVRCSDGAQPTTYGRDSITVPTIDSLLSLRPQGVGIRCIPDVLYALDVTGDVRISGDSISMTRHGATQKVIEVAGGDSTGLGIKISSGGGMLLGSGESANLFDVNQSEYMYITSDGQINFYTNCGDGLETAHRTYISGAGNLYCDGAISATKYLNIFPVGAIYMSVTPTNPSVYFGGTWEQWGKGRVPVGMDVDDSIFNTVEKTGGSKEQYLRASIGAVENNVGSIGYAATPTTPNHNVYNGVIYTGNGDTSTPRPANHATEVWQSNGNAPTTIQPYIVCYMWKRTA